jgi:hypothetical protein
MLAPPTSTMNWTNEPWWNLEEDKEINALLDREFKIPFSPSSLRSFVILMTPTKAATILIRCNIGNRPRKNTVEKMVGILKDGAWQLIQNGISFASSGELNNGQNRLLAIIETQSSVWMNCTFGEARRGFTAHDTNMAVRTAADTACIEGYKNGKAVAAGARIVKIVESGRYSSNIPLLNEEVGDFLRSHPGLERAAMDGQRIYRAKLGAAAATCAVYFIRRDTAQPHKVDNFIDRLSIGDDLQKSSPIFKLRTMAIENVHQLSNEKIDSASRSVAQAAAIINTWNFYVTGAAGTAAKIKWDGSSFPAVK